MVKNTMKLPMNECDYYCMFQSPQADAWILPVIQGFVQIEACKVEVGRDQRSLAMEPFFEVI
jgi:hypothetical protein